MSESEYEGLLPDDAEKSAEFPAEADDEIPPTPVEAEYLRAPSLHERRAEAMKRMLADPERKARYDEATEQILSHPAVSRAAATDAAREERMELVRAEFIKRAGRKL